MVQVQVYGDLIVAMTDPKYKDKTFYMPPTRDLTLVNPHTHLFIKTKVKIELLMM